MRIDACARDHAKLFLLFNIRIPQPLKSLLLFGCSLFHDITDALHKFVAYYLRMPIPWAYSKLFLPYLNHACHLNTVNFVHISGASPAICNKLKVSVDKNHNFKKNFYHCASFFHIMYNHILR